MTMVSRQRKGIIKNKPFPFFHSTMKKVGTKTLITK